MISKLSRSLLNIVAFAQMLGVLAQAQALPMMTHHVHAVVRSGEAKSLARMPSGQIMNLHLVLPLKDQAGLDAFLADIYNPASANFHHYLTVAQFTERFGPTQADYAAVLNFVKTNGFEVVGGSRDGMDVQIKGSVAIVENAFHVNMLTYQHPTESRTFYSPDREPTTNLPFPLWHVSGLDNYSLPHPLFVKRSAADSISHATTGSGPSASFLGSDMRAAYYGGTTLTGAGQNLGLFEYLGTDLADLNTYYQNVGQTNTVPITLLSTDGTSTSCTESNGACDDTEQTLDMTQALGMAPGLASLVVYVGSLDTAIISAMTTHSPLPTTIGCSWGWTPADSSTLDPYFKKMGAQGQTFFAASGDDSTWTRSGKAAAWPADDAYIVSVGGTDLVTTGAGGAWASETAWSDSGGGVSPDNIAIPAWQQLAGVINSSNNGSTTKRNGPDVSANANFSFYVCADQTTCTANTYGGTSFAAPMWAAYLALANQQAAANGAAPLGFINPTIYAQNITSVYAADFHDITSGTSGRYSAVTGYDLVTGWGSPNGAALINALVPVTNYLLTTAASPSQGGTVTGGGTYSPGTVVNITAVPNSGYSFVNWTGSVANPASASTTVTMNAPQTVTANFALISSAAQYVGRDILTQGTWTGEYGGDGYSIVNGSSSVPSYAALSFSGGLAYTWTPSTTDVRALQTSSGVSSRIASAYYSASSFTLNLNLTDGNTHRVALYLLDWDSTTRAETISILNANTQAVLSTQTFSNFHNGEYAIWNLAGNVIIQITNNGGSNAVVAGLFFDPAAAPSSAATYSGVDVTTQGTWTGQYGADGNLIATETAVPPAYAAVSFTGASTYAWAASTTDPRALQTTNGASTRIASTYYGGSSFTINVNLTDSNTHRIALYLLDWDTSARTETISLIDANTHLLLDTESYSSFHNGVYATWDIKGDVLIQVTDTGGANPVVAGLFFDPVPATPAASASYVGTDTTTEGTWTGVYGSTGEIIPNDITNTPAFATVSVTGDSTYTWAASTSDTRALQTSSNASSRIASTYYAAGAFTIAVNLTDGNTHKIALYLLDWDSTTRAETISVIDANSHVLLNTQSYYSFHNGAYAVWNVKGNVLIQVTNAGGANAVVSGVLFD